VFFFVHNFSLPLFAPIFIYILFSSACTIVQMFIQIGYRNNFVIYPCTYCIHCLCNKYLKKKNIYIHDVPRMAYFLVQSGEV